MSYDHYIVELSGNSTQSAHRLGGKASWLNSLISANCLVPRTCCITVDAYHAFLMDSGLKSWIDSIEKLDAKIRTEVREYIEQAEIHPSMRRAILRAYKKIGGGRVAISPSTIAENNTALPSLGPNNTFLHVHGDEPLLSYVKRCWLSLWEDQPQFHRGTEGAAKENRTGIAVVIQEMIDADVAGILFTMDPVSGNSKRIVIESCWGLGEGVLSGHVTTDTYVVDREERKVVESTIRTKTLMSSRGEFGGVTIQKVPKQLVTKRTLSNDQVLALAAQANKIRRFYGTELDIEWAIKDGKIWVLQVKPIAVTKLRTNSKLFADAEENSAYVRENAMFSRLDADEMFNGLMTPLGLSFCRFYQHNIHGAALKKIGRLDAGASRHYLGYIQGHVYLNVSASAQLLAQSPAGHDAVKFTKRFATSGMDLSQYENPYRKPIATLNYVKSTLYGLAHRLRNKVTGKRMVKKIAGIHVQEAKRFANLDLSAMSLQALDEELRRVDRYFSEFCESYMPVFLRSLTLSDALTELSGNWLGDEGKTLLNSVTAPTDSLRTLDVTHRLRNLVRQVKQSKNLSRLFQETPIDRLVDMLKADIEGHHFWNDNLEPFIRDFGVHRRRAFDLSIPCWNEDPKNLLQAMLIYLREDTLPDAVTSANGKPYTRQLLARLPFDKRVAFRFLLRAYFSTVERREAIRPAILAATEFYRKILLEVMRRLNKSGILSMDDLPYIDFNEVREYVAGRKPLEHAFDKELIERNRQQHLLNRRMKSPPTTIIGGYTPQ